MTIRAEAQGDDAGRTAGAHPATGAIPVPTQGEKDGWIQWIGGIKPELSDKTLVEVQLGNGQTECGLVYEFLWLFDKNNPDCDILKYRVLKPRNAEQVIRSAADR